MTKYTESMYVHSENKPEAERMVKQFKKFLRSNTPCVLDFAEKEVRRHHKKDRIEHQLQVVIEGEDLAAVDIHKADEELYWILETHCDCLS